MPFMNVLFDSLLADWLGDAWFETYLRSILDSY